jgi:hypothetical protein
MFDIRDFGAKCDGDPASDDSAAWASAILAAQNAATNGSAIVYHPGGVSIIKHELTLGSNSIVQFIGGPNAVIKAGTGFPTDPTTPIAMLTISGTGFGSRFGAIRDIRFDGDGNAQVGLKVQAVQREFDNIAINNCTRIGLWVYGAQNCTFTSLTVESNGTSNALDANCWVDASAANNLFLRCQFSPTAGAGTQGEYNLVIRQSANITGLPPYPSLNRFIGCQFERVAMSYLGAILQRAGLNNAFIGCTINISGARYAVTIEKTEAGSPTSALLMLIDCVLSGQVNTGTAIKATTTDALAVGTQNLFLENFDYGFAVVNDAYVDLPAPFQVGSLPTGHLS